MSLFAIVGTLNEGTKSNELIMGWLSGEFCHRSLEKYPSDLRTDAAYNETLAAYSTALSFGPPSSNGLLSKWARCSVTC